MKINKLNKLEEHSDAKKLIVEIITLLSKPKKKGSPLSKIQPME